MAPKVVLTRLLDPDKLHGAAILASAADKGEIELTTYDKPGNAPREWVLEHVKGSDAVVVMLGDKINDEFLDAAGPSLRVVSTMSAGFDHVDTAALKRRGIRLGTTPDALTDATADIGAMLCLMASRRAGEGLRAVVDGKWPTMPWDPLLLCGRGIQGSTVGVVGFGKIGQLTAKRLVGFGIKRVLYATSQTGLALDPTKDHFRLAETCRSLDVAFEPANSLSHLAKESDFVVVCCTLTNETKGLIGKEFLKGMKPTAYVVNTARGPVVDSDALVEAVKEGRIAGAGLDVVEGEPDVGADHELVREPRIVVLPHVGSATVETRSLMSVHAARNCLAGIGIKGYEWDNEVKL